MKALGEGIWVQDAWVVDLPRMLEYLLPRLLPGFAVRILTRDQMTDDERRTWHAGPAIDLREDVYDGLSA